jgi:hypothetical protein
VTETGYSRQLIERTKSVWQPYAATPLSDQDAIDILDGMLELAGAVARLRSNDEAA